MMFKGKVLLFSLLLVFATSLYAGDVDPCRSEVGVSCTGMRVSICPAGDFEFISEGCVGLGGTDYIYVYARDISGNGIAGIPWTDYWMNACDSPAQELCLCSAPFAADFLTNNDGYTTFSNRIAGGGCVLTGGLWWAIQGKTLVDYPACAVTTCIAVQIVSPDLNGDCFSNLSDLGIFGLSYNKQLGQAGFNSCCDYNDDDKCNLSDFAFQGEHYQHECF